MNWSGLRRHYLAVALVLVLCSVAVAAPAAAASGASPSAPAAGSQDDGAEASDEVIEVSENVSVWERAILPLRPDADAAATVVPAPRVFVDHPAVPQGDLNRDRVAVFDPGTIPVTLSSANGADVSQFAGEDVQVLVAQVAVNRSDVPADDLRDRIDPDDVDSESVDQDVADSENVDPDVLESGSVAPIENQLADAVHPDLLADLASGEAPRASDAVRYELETARLDAEDGTLEYELQADEPGQYAVLVATGEPFTIEDGVPRLTGESGTVVGAETVAVHERSSAVAAPDSAAAGEAVSFDVDTDLTGERVDHAVVLYHEQSLLYSRTDLVVEDDAKRLPAPENVTVEHSIGEVNGVARAVGDVPESEAGAVDGSISGTFALSELLAAGEAQLGADVTDRVSVGTERLDASSTVVGGTGPDTTVAVQTLANVSTGTYRYVHVATDRTASGSVETSTGTVEVLPAEDGDGSDSGNESDDGDGTDDGERDDSAESDGDGDRQSSPLCPPTPGVGQASASQSVSGQSVGGDAHRLRLSDVPAGLRVCGTLDTRIGPQRPDVAFRSLSLTAAEELDLDATIGQSASSPAGVEPVPSDAGGAAFATVENGELPNASVEDVELTVRVDRGRLAADGVEVEDLVFWQHDGEEWSQVEHSVAQSGEEWLVAVVDADDLSTVAAGYRDAGASEGQTPGSTGAEASVIRTTAASVDRDVATTGDPVLVTATVEAAEQSEHVAELTVDGEPVATERVSVDASGTATVTFEHAFEEADTFDVAVDGVEAGTVTVESGATTVSESGDAQSGLAIGEALAALALVGVGVGVRSWNRRER